ncbi:M23 family metallopeptidase [Spirillospora sp. CA-294931]|uniref:M23 family metallopeptidase n=1 Tax=Spirillospora sp. CA-294931 TaxID=3240042 RepID=UPI003D89C0DC
MKRLDRRQRALVLSSATALAGALCSVIVTAPASAGARPDFLLPFPCQSVIEIKTYRGHNPDDKKMDMYRQGMPSGSPILAAADGYVHESFAPGGIEIRHGGGWFTTYMHMATRVPTGTWVKRGQQVGTMGSVGTQYPHLHHEQLYNPNSDQNADNQHIVNPVIQGEGPLVLHPDRPLTRTSSNCSGDPGPGKYNVDTHADAPGHSTPGGTRTGTLNKGTNYVYCRVWGPKVQVGSDYNHWWMKTDLDSGNPWQNQYVSAYYLARWGNDIAKDNNGNDLPNC